MAGRKFLTDIEVPSVLFTGGQSLSWNTKYHTVDVPTGDGAVAKIGVDTMFDIHNATGGTLLKGTIVYPDGTSTLGVSNVQKCISSSHETISGPIGLIAFDILNGNDGHVLTQGIIDPINTGVLSVGPVYLSATIAGELTSTIPTFPNYDVLVGVVDSASVIGVITVDPKFNLQNTLTNFWNGVFRESFNFLVTSNGTTVTGALSPKNGQPNMTMLFSDGFTSLITTPDATITLTPGTDIATVQNFVYILKTTKALTVSISNWPTEEHLRVATVVLRSAATTLTTGARKNHNYNDHIQSDNGQGHLPHITQRIRRLHADWDSGSAASVTGLPTNAYVQVTGGVVFQMHPQSVQAFSMPTDNISIINHFITPNLDITDLKTITADASGNSINNTSFSLVVWGIANKTGESSHLICNLPIGSYSKNTPELAVSDTLGYSVYTIPKEYIGTAYLIARFTFKNNGGTWTLYDTQDLRGKLPNTSAGGVVGGGAGVSTLLELTDTPSTYAGQALRLARVNAGETALEFSTELLPVNKVAVATEFFYAYDSALGTFSSKPPAITDVTGLTAALSGKAATFANRTDLLNVSGTNTGDQTLTGLDYAPTSGSANYIQNQNASFQSASMWINGTIKAGGLTSSNVIIDSGGNSILYFKESGVNRNILQTDLTVGNFTLKQFDNVGSLLRTALKFTNTTGNALFSSAVEAATIVKTSATSDDILLGDGTTTSLSGLGGGAATIIDDVLPTVVVGGTWYQPSQGKFAVGIDDSWVEVGRDGVDGADGADAVGGGDVSKVGTPVDNQIGVWTGDGTIEGTSNLTFNNNLNITNSYSTTMLGMYYGSTFLTNAVASSIYLGNPTGTDIFDVVMRHGDLDVQDGIVTATDFVLGSDRSLKTNITPLSNSELDIEYVEFNYKTDMDRRRAGVIADDIQEKHPDLVIEDKNGIKRVSYIDLLIREVNALKETVKDLKETVAQLKSNS